MKLLSKWMRAFVDRLWRWSAYTIIFLALMVGALRLFAPEFDAYRPDIETYLSEQMQRRVSMRAINFNWETNGPVVRIQALKIARREQDHLENASLGNAYLAIDFWRSLIQWRLVTRRIEFQNLHIVYRDIPSNMHSTLDTAKTPAPISAKARGNSDTSQRMVNWLLAQRTIEIYAAYAMLKTQGRKNVVVSLPRFTYHGSPERRQLNGTITTTSGSRLKLVADMRGTFNKPRSTLKLFIHGDQLNLRDFPFSAYGEKLNPSGKLNFKLWADWRGNKMTNLLLQGDLNALRMAPHHQKLSLAPVTLKWVRQGGHRWRFATTPFQIALNHATLPKFKLQGMRWQENGNDFWHMEGLQLPLSALYQIAGSYLSSNLRDWLSKAQVGGQLSRLSIQKHSGKNAEFSTSFGIRNLTLKQTGAFPGVSGINANVEMDQAGGRVSLSGINAQLQLQPLFRRPIPYHKLNAIFDWNSDTSTTKLTFKQFNLWTDDILFTARGILNLNKKNGGDISVSAEIQNGNAVKKSLFLPAGIMSKNLVGYLDRSIIDGKIARADIIVRGPLATFPYTGSDGIFDIRALTRNLTFKFQPNWPRARNLNAILRFTGNKMAIDANHAEIKGIKLRHAEADIADMSLDDPNLKLNISAAGDSGEALALLKQSPHADIAKSLSSVSFSGPLTLDLDINIPLGETPENRKIPARPATLNGSIRLQRNQLRLAQPALLFKNVSGRLAITQSGIRQGNISARLWGEPLTLNLSHGDHDDTTHTTKGTKGAQPSPDIPDIIGQLNGTLNTQGISELLSTSMAKRSSGAAPFNGTIRYYTARKTGPRQDAKLLLDFSSNVSPLLLDFPQPFYKAAGQKKSLTVNLDLSAQNNILKLEYAKILRLAAREHLGEWFGNVTVGGRTTRIPTERGWLIQGHFAKLDLVPWVKFINTTFNPEQVGQNDTGASTQKFIRFAISTDRLNVGSAYFDTFELNGSNTDGAWLFNLDAPKLKGQIRIPLSGKDPIRAHFKRLTVMLNPPTSDQPTKAPQSTKVPEHSSPVPWVTLPALQIRCEHCQLGQQPLGQINIDVIPASFGNTLSINWHKKDLFTIKLDGNWSPDGTQLGGTISSRNFTALTQYWGFASGIRRSDLSASVALRWKGAPWQLSLAGLNGHVSARLGKGSLEEVSDKGTRLFSFLSFQTLRRRLSLDFSDVFEKGFFYDKIDAGFDIRAGIAFNQNSRIDGTAADIRMTGSTDLARGLLNQHIVVTPKLSASLPVLAGWAVSPPTALLALVLNKIIFKPALDVVSRIDYQLVGSWEKPELTELSKQNKEIKIEKPPAAAGKKSAGQAGTATP